MDNTLVLENLRNKLEKVVRVFQVWIGSEHDSGATRPPRIAQPASSRPAEYAQESADVTACATQLQLQPTAGKGTVADNFTIEKCFGVSEQRLKIQSKN